MRKLNYIFLLSCILFFSTCKKENNSGSGSSGPGSTPNMSPSSCYGILMTTKAQTLQGGFLFPPSYFATAYFSSSQTALINVMTFVKATSVYFNNTKLKWISYDYQDTTHIISSPPATWAVQGLGTVPSFTYTDNSTFPSYGGYTSLPDTITKSSALTVNVSAIGGADEVDVIVSDGTGHTSSQTLATGGISVTFPAGSLSSINLGNAYIDVNCIKNNVQSLGGKNYNLQNSYQLTKVIYVK